MNDLYITWNYGRGQMTIHMDQFFPCTMQKFKKLLKIIELDWQHEDELKQTLKVYFQNRIPKLPGESAAKKKEAAEYRAKAKEAKVAFNTERKRIRNGGKPPYFNTKFDAEYQNNRYFAQQAEAEAKRLLKSKEQFEKYLEFI